MTPTPYQEGLNKRLFLAEEDAEMNHQEYRHFALLVPLAIYSRPFVEGDPCPTVCRECGVQFYTKKGRKAHSKETACVSKIEAYYAKRKTSNRCVVCACVTKDRFLGFPVCKTCLFQFKTSPRLMPNYEYFFDGK